jgi:uncharacterized protein YbjT (DUF2867 family)
MPKYLIIGATGQQGGATIDALLSKGVPPSDVFGVTRNPDSESSQEKVVAKGVTAIKGDLSSKASVKEAIVSSKAETIWFMTDFFAAGSAEAETQQGKNVIDAILECGDQVKYVVYSSVGDADNCPKTIEHFWSKARVEEYMADQLSGSLKIEWAVIRPVFFIDNLDSPAQRNPLTKGKVTGLTKPKTLLKQIALVDIGKASAIMLQDPETFAGTKLEAAGCQHTGVELAEILTKVSGTPCKYKMMPRWFLWLFMRDVYHMARWFDVSGYTADIDEFKKVVPDAMDASDWFKAKGQWSDGEKFASSEN